MSGATRWTAIMGANVLFVCVGVPLLWAVVATPAIAGGAPAAGTTTIGGPVARTTGGGAPVAGTLGGGTATGAGGGGSSAGGLAGSCAPVAPYPTTTLAALPKTAPSSAAATRLLAGIRHYYVEQHGAKQAAAVDALLRKAKSQANGTAGVLYLMGYLRASVYAFAQAARRKPDDVLLWANLGAALNDAGRYVKAAAALRYALKLEPKNAIAESNLGILYARLGDDGPAVALLKQSLKALSGQLEANLALAELYQCGHRPRLALQAARTAYAIKPTQRGRKIIERIGKSLGKPDGWVDYRGIDDRGTGWTPGGGSGPAPAIPYPNFPQLADFEKWEKLTWGPEVKKLVHEFLRRKKQAQAVGLGNIPDLSDVPNAGLTGWQLSQRDHSRTTFYFSYIAQQEHFNNLYDSYFWKINTNDERYENLGLTLAMAKELKREHHKEDAAAKAGLAAMSAPPYGTKAFCRVALPVAKANYRRFKPAYHKEYETVAALIKAYYRRTDALLKQFPNPDDVHALDLERQSNTLKLITDLYADAASAVSSVAFLGAPGGCSTAESAGQGVDVGPLPKGKGGECHVRYGINIGIFKGGVDCEKLQISGGELIKLGFDWDFRRHVGTVYLGAGLGLAFQGAAGPVTAGPAIGAQAGLTLTFDRNGLLDGGLYEKGQATIYNRSMTGGNPQVIAGIGAAGKATLTITNGLQYTGHANDSL